MARYSNLVSLGFLIFVSHVSVVVSQSSGDCDKYCFDSCGDYFDDNVPEFSRCVTANVNCSCILKFKIRNPFLIFILILITISGCRVCYRMKVRSTISRSNAQRIIAQPVLTSPVMSNPTGNISHGHTTNADLNHHQPNAPGFAYPVATQNPIGVPTEYLGPPPAYNTCVVDMDYTKQIGRFQQL